MSGFLRLDMCICFVFLLVRFSMIFVMIINLWFDFLFRRFFLDWWMFYLLLRRFMFDFLFRKLRLEFLLRFLMFVFMLCLMLLFMLFMMLRLDFIFRWLLSWRLLVHRWMLEFFF
jgi:hypothetical protein